MSGLRLTTEPAMRFGSEVTRFELRDGAMSSSDSGASWERIEAHIVPLVRWLPIDAAVAMASADLVAFLRRDGRPVGWADAMLAAAAPVCELTMVTRNARHFDRMPGLVVESGFE